jgi:hypothetical protein
MQKPALDPDVTDTAPGVSTLTPYDYEHLSADWREVALLVLHIDPDHETGRARRAYESHLSRAEWMTEHGTCICWDTAYRA